MMKRKRNNSRQFARTTIASITKEMQQPRCLASVRDGLLRDAVEPIIDELWPDQCVSEERTGCKKLSTLMVYSKYMWRPRRHMVA
jgi:hypothetical protein